MSKVYCAVINLNASTDRMARAKYRLSAARIEFERLEAVDGRLLDPTTLECYDSQQARYDSGRDISAGEIACYLSHTRFLGLFLETQKEFGLVFEDDLKFNEGGEKTLNTIISMLENQCFPCEFLVINLGAPHLGIYTPVASLGGVGNHPSLVNAHYFPLLATGLLWTREGARAFLRERFLISRPIDQMLRNWVLEAKGGLAIDLPPIRSDGSESTISEIHRARTCGSRLRRSGKISAGVRVVRKIRMFARAIANMLLFRLKRAIG